jgi:hypothetical protein
MSRYSIHSLSLSFWYPYIAVHYKEVSPSHFHFGIYHIAVHYKEVSHSHLHFGISTSHCTTRRSLTLTFTLVSIHRSAPQRGFSAGLSRSLWYLYIAVHYKEVSHSHFHFGIYTSQCTTKRFLSRSLTFTLVSIHRSALQGGFSLSLSLWDL